MERIGGLGFVLLGFAVGAVGTLLGAGGGFLVAPLLLLLYRKENPEALTSISLAVVFFNAASGSIAYARMKRIDYRAGILFATAAVPGSILGSLTTQFIPRTTFDLLFGAVMVGAGAYLLFSPVRAAGSSVAGAGRPGAASSLGAEARRPGAPDRPSYNLPLGMGISAVVGYLSSVLGVGGGFIHVPALARLLGFPVHTATATSHFILAIMALTGTLAHIGSGSFGHQGFRLTALLAAGVIPGAQLGAWLSNRVSGSRIIRGLAVVLVAVGLHLFRQALR